MLKRLLVSINHHHHCHHHHHHDNESKSLLQLRTGVYVTLWNDRRKHECSRSHEIPIIILRFLKCDFIHRYNHHHRYFRLGRLSRCFCNHLYGKHSLVKLKNGRFGKAPCTEVTTFKKKSVLLLCVSVCYC